MFTHYNYASLANNAKDAQINPNPNPNLIDS